MGLYAPLWALERIEGNWLEIAGLTLLLGVAWLSQQQWVDAVFATAAAVGFLASYFWLKHLHMISLYKGVQRILEDEQNCFAATLKNGRRVFFWNHHFAGSGKAFQVCPNAGADHPLVS